MAQSYWYTITMIIKLAEDEDAEKYKSLANPVKKSTRQPKISPKMLTTAEFLHSTNACMKEYDIVISLLKQKKTTLVRIIHYDIVDFAK